ncbi:hypothetical protein KCTC32516_01996 [Polaribacter huanghezhanensis]|uniref:hypothetical protein n=1 Tax=Polaribacter huanghezhanensis TaxID=1354726 RepID=UPI002648AC98|nr:hypothetical protein [Polaribacter huanghezhanensis]WKD86620.1 hypothetical protein KCTC32516_01996 [Polaribacter huanghezhanensis]
MSFLIEAFPKVNFSDKIVNPKGEIDSPCTLIPNNLLMVLKKTPIGLKTIDKFNKCCKDNYKRKNKPMLEISLSNEQLYDLNESQKKTTDHGRTYYKGGWNNITQGVKIDITMFDTKDRMANWKEEEKLSIISIHESKHLKFQKRNKTKYNVITDECSGFWSKCHLAAFELEFKARLEFSLLNMDESTQKENWIKSYFKMFEVFERFFSNPLDSEKKLVRDIKKKAKIQEAKNLNLSIEDIKTKKINYDYNSEFTLFKDNIINTGNFENGKRECFQLYNEVIENFSQRLQWLDGRINHATLSEIKKMVKNKNDYLNDTEFNLIK